MEHEPGTERTPPAERFASPAVAFDLEETVARLVHETNPGKGGHRQIALYKQGSATIALFRFEPDGAIPDHKAPGTVFIQCLDGRIDVKVGDEAHPLRRGGLLVLAPGVRHDVRAIEASTMLLTVCLEPK